MENTTEKLLNINGEYIKFYVTTNDKLSKLLANSGAAIIYHNTKNKLNYIYVGGQLIASGYGFDINDHDKLKELLEKYYLEIKDIIDNKKIQTSYNNLSNYVNDTFVKKSEGDISYTYIHNDFKKLFYNPTSYSNELNITSKDIYNYIEDIKYKRFEITDLCYIIEYKLDSDSSSPKIMKICFRQNDKIALPVNSLITSLTVNALITLNDNGGSNNIKMTYLKSNKNPEQLKYGIVNVNKNNPINDNVINNINIIKNKDGNINDLEILNESIYNIYNDFGVITDEYYVFKIVYNGNADNLIKINEGNNKIIKDINLSITGTPKEKYKSFTFNQDIKSIKNILNNEEVSIKNEMQIQDSEPLLNIVGAHEIFVINSNNQLFDEKNKFKYDITSVINPNSLNSNNYPQGCLLSTIFKTLKNESFRIVPSNYVFNNKFSFTINEKNYAIFFTIPSIYEIKRIYYINQDGTESDIIGYFIYCGNQKYEDDTNVLFNKDGHDYKLTNNTKLFYMYSVSRFNNAYTVYVELIRLKNEDLPDPDTRVNIIPVDGHQILHQYNFDINHWYNYPAIINMAGNSFNNSYTLLENYIKMTAQYL